MKHLKKFENFFVPNDPDSENREELDDIEMDDQRYLDSLKDEDEDIDDEDCEGEDCDAVESPRRRRVWGDEIDEKKKSKEVKEESDENVSGGLTAKQRKLPAGLQKAILARSKKKKK